MWARKYDTSKQGGVKGAVFKGSIRGLGFGGLGFWRPSSVVGMSSVVFMLAA